MENKDVVQPVAENVEEQTLQPETVAGAAKEEAAQQTEEMVAEQTEQVIEQGFRPNKKQTAVAVMFVAGAVLAVLKTLFIMMIPYDDLRMLLSCLPNMIFAVSWLMLAFLAVNKAVRVAAFIGTGAMVLSFLYYVPVWMIANLGLIYAVSLIVRNCEMAWTSRTWINLIALIASSSLAIFLSRIFVKLPDYIPMEHYVLFSPYNNAWQLLLVALKAVANWKLARSEAFAGKYDGEAVPDFRPVNKWTVMALVVPIVIVVALVVIYSNISWFI